MEELSIATLISEYGFPIVMMVGLGYFVYYVWWFVGENLEPEVEKQHFALIKLIDQVRMLDQDLIRLQQKVDVVLEMKENLLKQAGEKNAENNNDSN
jgi:hypothetical protein|tara:strand:+ start:7458 stop:7748 length:291 start_codon:yes stop_codon:yes gene_type:complete